MRNFNALKKKLPQLEAAQVGDEEIVGVFRFNTREEAEGALIAFGARRRKQFSKEVMAKYREQGRRLQRVRDYVEQGGRLLTVGPLGEERDADVEFPKRDKPLLQEWCGEQPADTAWVAPLGRGKIAFTPRTVPGYTESALTLAPEFMSAADEVGLFRQFSLAGSSLVQAPIEVTIRASGERRMLHLIRLGPPESVPDQSVAFSYELPAGQEVESAQASSPQPSPEQLQLNWSIKEGRFEGQLNRLENYVVIEVKLKKREK